MTHPVKAKTVWKDKHAPAKNRFVLVLNEANEEGMVRIQTCFASPQAGYMPMEIEDGQISMARIDRFNGTSDGYEYAARSIHEMRRKNLHINAYVRQWSKSQKPLPEVGCGEAGEFWLELNSRYVRIVEVLGDKNGKREIATRFFSAVVGKVPAEMTGVQRTEAKIARFNGKSTGYRFLAKNLESLQKTGILNKPFQQKNDVYIIEKIVSAVGQEVKEGQLWQDFNSERVRMVTVSRTENNEVDVRCVYLGPTKTEQSYQIQHARPETFPMSDFADGRFGLVKAV